MNKKVNNRDFRMIWDIKLTKVIFDSYLLYKLSGSILKRLINFYFLIILIGCVPELEEMKYPETKQDKITEDIFGKNIEDPYRWLEDFTSSSLGRETK